MDKLKKLSIVLITRNSKSVLFDCLKALNNNDDITSSENSQWIIVDNDSNDGSIEEVEKLYPQTIVIKNKENSGFAKAANQGFNVSESEYILYINTDTEIKRDSISKLYNKIVSDKDIAVIGPRLLRKNNTIQKSVYPEATLYTEIFKPIIKLYVSIKENFYKVGNCYTVNSLRGACFIINKQYMKQVGGFDERYFFYLEETDLFRHLKLIGKKICYFPESEVYHYGGLGSDDKMTFNKKKMYNESLLKYFDKNRNKFENFIIRKLIKTK
ncbi:MAG: glycosyltransferase family 2 protein [Endomicrobiaceae bacterium]|nr:glycosyltransferase family 2 protein [Endomicrobiaceae bacterium]